MSNLIDHAKKEFELLGWPGDCEMQKMQGGILIKQLRSQ